MNHVHPLRYCYSQLLFVNSSSDMMFTTLKISAIVSASITLLALVQSYPGDPQGRFSGRILGGTNSTLGQWPFAVSIQSSAGSHHFCGGTIISPTCIVSAGHCFQPEIGTSRPSDVNIVAGMTYWADDIANLQIGNLDQIHVHEKYDSPKPFFNDISLLVLSEPLNFNDHVQPAVVSSTKFTDFNVVGKLAMAIGWGNTKFMKHGSAISHSLLYVKQQVWTHAKCKATIPEMADWEDCIEVGRPRKECVGSWFYHEAMVCAGGVKGEDACQGDSGGPFVFKRDDGTNVLVGAVSIGNACGLPGNPGVYTNVGYYRDWIKSKCPDFEAGGRPDWI